MTKRSFALSIVSTLLCALTMTSMAPAADVAVDAGAVKVAAPAPAPTAVPTLEPSDHPRANDSEHNVFVCAGIAGEAVAQGDSARTVLAAVEYMFTYEFGGNKRLIFDEEDNNGDCPYKRDVAIVEVVYARIRTKDDNYIVLERHSEGVDIGVVVRAPDGQIAAQAPIGYPNANPPIPGADGGAWISSGTSQNQIALLGATSIALIANARNPDKTAAAAASVFAGFSALMFPVYHQSDVQYATLRGAARDITCRLIRQLAQTTLIPGTPGASGNSSTSVSLKAESQAKISATCPRP